MNNIVSLFIKTLERYKSGDQTHKDWIEKVFLDTWKLSRGTIGSHLIDPSYRELCINLVHMDKDFYAQSIASTINSTVIKHTLSILSPVKSVSTTINKNNTKISTSSAASSGCGCSN